ncbi:class F sortase [Bacillus sp. DJP31]|uniref:class F sortase n=1 Tax=Bacillus sp. DJP31 TaxID=3409789 RepID=UPI003BB80EA5
MLLELPSFFSKEKISFNLKILLLLFLVGCQSIEPEQETEQAESNQVVEVDQEVKVQQSITSRVVSISSGIEPSTLSIPALDLGASVESVGLQCDGQMEVPKDFTKVGWYSLGAKAGQAGTVVLAGHVDSYTGPAIFSSLDRISINDEISISNGEEIIVYTVTKKESYPYSDGPLQEIFGFTAEKRLHLITCTGTFNPFKGTHEERLVGTAIAK